MSRRLRLQFDRAEEFQREFDRNIAKGGVFVPGAEDLELREVVEVELDLKFCGMKSRLEAEVVHVVSPDTASTSARVGAAVQFLRSAPELRKELAGVLPAPTSARGIGGERDQWQLEGLEDETALELEGSTGPVDLALDDVGTLENPRPTADPASQDGFALDLAEEEEERDGDLFGTALDFSATTPASDPPTQPVLERRSTPRSRARVPATLDGPNAHIEGVTRDLSETGALISADASEFPVGKRVRLSLQHPEGGKRLEVGGRVTRHVETEGTVAAVAVLFDATDDQKSELAALVHAAQSAHEERASAGISGLIEELGMANLIQMLGSSSPLGTLAVRSGAEEGVLAFDSGYLRYARLGATRGLKALSRMMQWKNGSFEFHAHVAALDDEDEPVRLEAALLELTRRADETARGRSARFDGAQRFRIDRAALAATETLDKTEEAVLDLAAAGFTVRRIHDVIPESDAQVGAALLALVERGVLEPD